MVDPETRATEDAFSIARPGGLSDDSIRRLFTAASFLGSFLLFLIQPMVARFLLPIAGGSSSLWNTAMVFFQVTLLVGYLYAHYSTTRFGGRQPFTQIAVVAVPLAVLPIALPDGWVLGNQTPTLWVLGALTIMVGLPFFALATSSPTLQRWFSLTGHAQSDDPYFLYSAGNIGSVLALLGYPLVLERMLTLNQQASLWAAIYVVFVVATALCAYVTHRSGSVPRRESEAAETETLTWKRRGRWVLWAFVPSALMIGVTGHLAADVASFPLLWVLPLLLYLTTFIIVFKPDGGRRSPSAELVVLIGSILVAITILRVPQNLALTVGVHLGWFFAAALVAHKRLAADRPAPARLTEFYALISVGGALGGIFASLIAPVVFTSVLEYPIAIVAALLVVPIPVAAARRANPLVLVSLALGLTAAFLAHRQIVLAPEVMAVAALIGVRPLRRPTVVAAVLGMALVAHVAVPPANVIFRDRSFFGVSRVNESAARTVLMSGTTVHGYQLNQPDGSSTPTSYYARVGPVGQLMATISDRDTIGIIGLGTGTVAAYGAPGDTYVYFEIDPVVIDIATDPDLFGFLSDSAATIDVREGDGRQGVANSTETFDVLFVDAFSSDAIPVHLITREAIDEYRTHLADNGVMAFHISNRFFDLVPVLGRVADELDLAGVHQLHEPELDDPESEKSHWVLIGEPAAVDAVVDGRWSPLPTDGPLWTDDYSNLLAVLRY